MSFFQPTVASASSGFASALVRGDVAQVQAQLHAAASLAHSPIVYRQNGDLLWGSPLSVAVRTQSPQMIAALLAAGADPNAAQVCGRSLLEMAIVPPDFGQAGGVVSLLLAGGADPHAAHRTNPTVMASPLALALAGNGQEKKRYTQNTSPEATATAQELLAAAQGKPFPSISAWHAWNAVLLHRNDAWCTRLRDAGADPVPCDQDRRREGEVIFGLVAMLAGTLPSSRLAWAFEHLAQWDLEWWADLSVDPLPPASHAYAKVLARHRQARLDGALVATADTDTTRRSRF